MTTNPKTNPKYKKEIKKKVIVKDPKKSSPLNPSVRRLLKSGAESQLFSSPNTFVNKKIKKSESRDLKINPEENQLYRIQPRMSKKAIELVSFNISNYIQDLGKECLVMLDYSRQKTINMEMIHQIVSIPGGKCSFKGSSIVLRYCTGMVIPQNKKKIKITFSVIKRELEKVMSLHKSDRNAKKNANIKKNARISSDAKVAFIHLIETYIRLIGSRAILFTHSAKRETIKTDDINKVMLCL